MSAHTLSQKRGSAKAAGVDVIHFSTASGTIELKGLDGQHVVLNEGGSTLTASLPAPAGYPPGFTVWLHNAGSGTATISGLGVAHDRSMVVTRGFDGGTPIWHGNVFTLASS